MDLNAYMNAVFHETAQEVLDHEGFAQYGGSYMDGFILGKLYSLAKTMYMLKDKGLDTEELAYLFGDDVTDFEEIWDCIYSDMNIPIQIKRDPQEKKWIAYCPCLQKTIEADSYEKLFVEMEKEKSEFVAANFVYRCLRSWNNPIASMLLREERRVGFYTNG